MHQNKQDSTKKMEESKEITLFYVGEERSTKNSQKRVRSWGGGGIEGEERGGFSSVQNEQEDSLTDWARAWPTRRPRGDLPLQGSTVAGPGCRFNGLPSGSMVVATLPSRHDCGAWTGFYYR